MQWQEGPLIRKNIEETKMIMKDSRTLCSQVTTNVVLDDNKDDSETPNAIEMEKGSSTSTAQETANHVQK
eukprot:2804547-Ditylum_brightwellii.AAC.1